MHDTAEFRRATKATATTKKNKQTQAAWNKTIKSPNKKQKKLKNNTKKQNYETPTDFHAGWTL